MSELINNEAMITETNYRKEVYVQIRKKVAMRQKNVYTLFDGRDRQRRQKILGKEAMRQLISPMYRERNIYSQNFKMRFLDFCLDVPKQKENNKINNEFLPFLNRFCIS